LPVIETELRRYLAQGQFPGISFALPQNIATRKALATRNLTPVENYFRLGDELLRIDRLDAAEKYFHDARALAPASPLPYEGLGLLALQREQPAEALRQLKQAVTLNSGSFLAHYLYAWEQFKRVADDAGQREALPPETTAEIHDELLKSLTLMPNFGPAHELFGIFELAQEHRPTLAAAHLQLAAQLEPENLYYLLPLAEAQMEGKDFAAAKNTLAPLLLPAMEEKLRAPAEKLLRQLTQPD
jgi:tetratricopeptide (TPR) repeat protein